MTFAFVDICLTAWSRKSLRTIARKRTRCIHTNAVMFTWRTLIAFVNVHRTIDALVTGRTRTRKRSVNRTGVTDRIMMARIRCTCIVQMAQ